ncbi:phytoene desaturase family protein [Dasania marina]|uniref:phytoene desaturase family protein n=1 Tax=Dasania marina TaxID=471499 RepID=UPI00037830E8|nr:NAD(P)/FAD-dependent oxidoreductase [Dasania marina]
MNNKHYDAIIIGGGHNGLACAGYLAKAGKRVLVLEAAEQLGGLGATREFAPGFKASVAHTLPQLTNKLVNDLQLRKHGFELAASSLATVALSPAGQHITIANGEVQGASAADAESYKAYKRLLGRFADTMDATWHKTPPVMTDGGFKDASTLGMFGLKVRTLGKTDMREFMRMIFLPAQDMMDEFFETPLLKAALSWDYNVGNKLAPRSPNNAVLNQLLKMSGDISGNGSLPLPKGGVGGLINALEKSAKAHGAEIRTSSPVASVVVDDMQATGVLLENGDSIRATHIISNADPKTSFFKLLGAQHLDVEFTQRINRLRMNGLVSKVHLALNSEPKFTGLNKADGRMIIAPTMQYIENAFDHAKYKGLSEQPTLEVIVPSLHDNSLADAGKHVVSIQVQYTPYDIEGGWDAQRDTLLENVIKTLEQYAPDIRSQIVASELLTPVDLEQQFRVTGGHWHHGEFAIDAWWMNRPAYGASQYKSPVAGFYNCGAGSHPGGGIMGAAGANAANHILKEEK